MITEDVIPIALKSGLSGDSDIIYQANSDSAFIMSGFCEMGCSARRLHVYLDKNGEMQAVAFQG
ncbi:hypothetical protein, partial [Acetobacter aceti]